MYVQKWTPSYRLFPKRGTRQIQPSAPGVGKSSILLDYGGSVTQHSGGASAAAVGSVQSDLSTTTTPQLVLPSLPELLAFVVANTDGRVVISAAAAHEAEEREAEAVLLEHAYAQTLDYMEVWRTFRESIDAGMFDVAPKNEEQTAEELQRRIIACYRFIVDEGGSEGSVAGALERLQHVADLVQSARIAERLARIGENDNVV